MKTLMLTTALALLCAGPASAGCDYNRCGDPNMNYRFNNMLGIIAENALRPPYHPPLPAYMPPEYYAPPCVTYPADQHCQH